VFFFFFFLLFIFASALNPKQKKNKEKGIGIPTVMCITNDDAISNGSKCNNVMGKKKCLKKDKGGKKKEMIKKL
jgi:hypothetical protein